LNAHIYVLHHITFTDKYCILQKIGYCVDDSGLLGCDAKSLGKWFPLKEWVVCTFKSSRSIEGEGSMEPHPKRCNPWCASVRAAQTGWLTVSFVSFKKNEHKWSVQVHCKHSKC